jgi:molybdate transport system substrate-binding protein
VTAFNVVVFAAGSLANAFSEIGARYEAEYPGARVHCTFASADHLRQRLLNGERADVFASANYEELERARADGLLTGPIEVFAHNRLQVIVALDRSQRIESLADLARPGIRLAAEHTGAPLSGYTRALLARAQSDPAYGHDFKAKVAGNVAVEVATVRELVARVADGAADAGIVYVTDVTPNVRNRVSIVNVPDDVNVTADYAIGSVGAKARSGNPVDGPSFVSLVISPTGQSILERWGFERSAELRVSNKETRK